MIYNQPRLSRIAFVIVVVGLSIAQIGCSQQPYPDISTVEPDLTTPGMVNEEPAPGKRVKVTPIEYAETEVYHALFLPTDWDPEKKYPVIVEYAGNDSQANEFGDRCTGRVEDCNLGFGISGGEGFIWVCLPYISSDKRHNQGNWWGDLDATVAYAKTEVPRICEDFGGDSNHVFLAGFSRGAIACNFVGLHDDEIANLWCGFICHSHYDGVQRWHYQGSDEASAVERLCLLGNRPQFISHENSLKDTKEYLADRDGDFTFQVIPFRNHTDTWVLRDIPARDAVRSWINQVMNDQE